MRHSKQRNKRFMIIAYTFFFVTCTLSMACRQPVPAQKDNHEHLVASEKDQLKLSFDSNKIAIISSEKTDFFGLKDSIRATLSNQDLILIDELLNRCVSDHNKDNDSTKLYSAFIDLKRYKRQYVPFASTMGDKKVFISCFCAGVDNSDKWKHSLLVVDDGGRCFFAVFINLTKKTYSPLMINGPG